MKSKSLICYPWSQDEKKPGKKLVATANPGSIGPPKKIEKPGENLISSDKMFSLDE